MTDEERIERLENKLKEALSWWRATEKQLSQKCKETKANQKTIERLKAENAELCHRAEVAERALQIAEELGELCAPARDYIKQAEQELAKEKKNDN